ncbi:MAG: hypothetical protein M1828_004669 [Chrysothrix sp. TS-e1954]|nr:MAG: hypothetical protein M1828_004669 [Chrysothrix sp. TS-e1954]
MAESSLWARAKQSFTMHHNYSVKPLGFAVRSHTLFIVSTVGMGLFTDLFLYGLVVPILPYTLEDRVHVPHDQVQSYTSGLLAAYAGASVLLSPLAGFIADKTSSRQLPFVGGLSALILATILLFTGSSIPVLVIARVAQGASSAFVWTVGLALCIDTVGPENLGKTIGSIFSFISVGELFAPVLGGVLYKKAGYGAVAGLAIGVLVIDLVMRLMVIEKKVATRYDEKQVNADHDGQDSQNQAGGAEGDSEEQADENTGLLGTKKESDQFVIPRDQPAIIRNVPLLYCFTNSSLVLAQVVAFMQATLLAAFDATIPTHANDLFGFDSLKSGILFIPLGVMNCLIGPLAGWAIDRYGPKPLAVIGYLYLVPALAVLRIPQSEPYTQQSILYGGLLGACGVGLAIIGAPSIVEAGTVVEKFYKRNPDFFGENGPYGQLYSINSMVFCLGLTVGPLLGGALTESIGYGNANAVLAACSFVVAVGCFFYLGGPPRMFRKKESYTDPTADPSFGKPPTFFATQAPSKKPEFVTMRAALAATFTVLALVANHAAGLAIQQKHHNSTLTATTTRSVKHHSATASEPATLYIVEGHGAGKGKNKSAESVAIIQVIPEILTKTVTKLPTHSPSKKNPKHHESTQHAPSTTRHTVTVKSTSTVRVTVRPTSHVVPFFPAVRPTEVKPSSSSTGTARGEVSLAASSETGRVSHVSSQLSPVQSSSSAAHTSDSMYVAVSKTTTTETPRSVTSRSTASASSESKASSSAVSSRASSSHSSASSSPVVKSTPATTTSNPPSSQMSSTTASITPAPTPTSSDPDAPKIIPVTVIPDNQKPPSPGWQKICSDGEGFKEVCSLYAPGVKPSGFP